MNDNNLSADGVAGQDAGVEQDDVILRVENLCQYFKKGRFENKAVNNVSFNIKKGEVLGLVGESGCGKTTTGRTIIKLYDATSGNVYLKGQRVVAGTGSYKANIKEASARLKQASSEEERARLNNIIAQNREQIRLAVIDHKLGDKIYARKQIELLNEEYLPLLEKAKNTNSEEHARLLKEYNDKKHVAKNERLINQMQMIFQDPIASLNPRMTVLDIISEGLIIKGVKDKDFLRQRVYEVLDLVGLVPEHANRYPHEFSGGQRQRIGIARAIIMNPDILIADEPVSALDVSIQAQVINLLNDLRNKIGLTILFIAHNLSVIKYFSDRIAVMYYGNIVEMASSQELFKNPCHPYTKALLSAIPYPDPHYEKQRQRILYNPIADHDYKEFKPSLREITKEHFVYCNDPEFEKYKKEMKA